MAFEYRLSLSACQSLLFPLVQMGQLSTLKILFLSGNVIWPKSGKQTGHRIIPRSLTSHGLMEYRDPTVWLLRWWKESYHHKLWVFDKPERGQSEKGARSLSFILNFQEYGFWEKVYFMYVSEIPNLTSVLCKNKLVKSNLKKKILESKQVFSLFPCFSSIVITKVT